MGKCSITYSISPLVFIKGDNSLFATVVSDSKQQYKSGSSSSEYICNNLVRDDYDEHGSYYIVGFPAGSREYTFHTDTGYYYLEINGKSIYSVSESNRTNDKTFTLNLSGQANIRIEAEHGNIGHDSKYLTITYQEHSSPTWTNI